MSKKQVYSFRFSSDFIDQVDKFRLYYQKINGVMISRSDALEKVFSLSAMQFLINDREIRRNLLEFDMSFDWGNI